MGRDMHRDGHRHMGRDRDRDRLRVWARARATAIWHLVLSLSTDAGETIVHDPLPRVTRSQRWAQGHC